MAAHHYQRNSQERGRSQQLVNANRERRTQDYCERRRSQVAEMNPVHVEAHRSQRNSRERGRSQQLFNDNRERRTQDEAV